MKRYCLFIFIILFSCTQDPVVPLPSTPTNLSAVLSSATQVDLSWTDNSTNETGFKIDRKIGSGQWLNIGTVGANVVSYSDLGLTINTTYTYRVYAYNSAGNSSTYSNEVSITTVSVPLITTTSISNVTINSASSGGAISNDGGSAITSRGVVWSTATNPTIALPTKTSDGTGTGSFVSAISGLTAGTLYYVRAYATNAIGTGYGSLETFTTQPPSLPTVTTTPITSITLTGASSGGNITSDGGGSVTGRGVVWSTSPNPTIALPTKTSDGTGTGTFVSTISGLTAGTLFYVRAYATNSAGTAYGPQITFTTQAPSLPTVSTRAINSITANSATSGGNVTSDGGATVTARGVIWSTSPNPTISLPTKTTDGSGIGQFISNISGLAAGSYYVRAYATNSAGTAYGNQESFSTTSSSFTCGVSTVTFNYRGSPVTYGTVVGAGGRCWLDRNLGATRVAVSITDNLSYGDLFQWGRGDDGHQLRTAGTTTVLSSTDNPGHSDFIRIPTGTPAPIVDWRVPQNDNLWQGANGGINNVCPSGWRLPTYAEFSAEASSWNPAFTFSNDPTYVSANVNAGYLSPLKTPASGYRAGFTANFFDVGVSWRYWTSSIISSAAATYTLSHVFSAYGATNNNNHLPRTYGYSVRCIKN